MFVIIKVHSDLILIQSVADGTNIQHYSTVALSIQL